MNGSRQSWMGRERPLAGSSLGSQQPDLTTQGIYYCIISGETNKREESKKTFLKMIDFRSVTQIHAIYLTIILGFAKSAFLQVLWSHSRGEITCKNKDFIKTRQNSWQIPSTSYVEWAFLSESFQSNVLTIAVLKLGQPSKQDNIKYSDSW